MHCLMNRVFPGLLVCLLAMPLSAFSAWTDAPMLQPERVKGGDRRAQSLFRPRNLTVAQMVEFAPSSSTSAPKTLQSADDGRFLMNTSGRGEGNYHWVQAQSEDGLRSASTVHYFSNPGPSPRQLLKQQKLPLEIRPVDLPREHRRFRANETWTFEVLHQDSPLAGVPVTLETSKGTRQTMTTDQDGTFNLTFPDDFQQQLEDPHRHHRNHAAKSAPNAAGGGHMGHRRQSAKFVVSATHDGMTSAFNYKYSPDAFNNKSLFPAVGLLFGGSLITGLVLFRRRSS
jgi:hypothetical protein